MTAPPETLHIHIDGGSRGNPGDAGFGVHVATADGQERAGLYGYLGRATNNVAEYQALLHALRYALAQGATCVRLFSDSELVVKQMDGRYRVKTIKPAPYTGRTSHIHFIIAGGATKLTTQMFFPGEKTNESDGLWRYLDRDQRFRARTA